MNKQHLPQYKTIKKNRLIKLSTSKILKSVYKKIFIINYSPVFMNIDQIIKLFKEKKIIFVSYYTIQRCKFMIDKE